MSELLKSGFGLLSDAIKIVLAPAQVAIDLTRAVTKPVADLAEDTATEIGKTLKDKP